MPREQLLADTPIVGWALTLMYARSSDFEDSLDLVAEWVSLCLAGAGLGSGSGSGSGLGLGRWRRAAEGSMQGTGLLCAGGDVSGRTGAANEGIRKIVSCHVRLWFAKGLEGR